LFEIQSLYFAFVSIEKKSREKIYILNVKEDFFKKRSETYNVSLHKHRNALYIIILITYSMYEVQMYMNQEKKRRKKEEIDFFCMEQTDNWRVKNRE
jgi:predicted NUDIX family phosphoesterase